MSDKLEALSQPAAVMYADGYVMTREECGNAFAACCETQSPLYSQEYVTALLAALERSTKNEHALGGLLDEMTRRRDSHANRANAAEQREGHLKASVDVLSAKNAELQQRLQQPIKLPKIEIGMACEFVSDHIVVSLAAVLAEAATAGFKAEVEGE